MLLGTGVPAALGKLERLGLGDENPLREAVTELTVDLSSCKYLA